MPLAASYRRACVRSSHERDRPPPRGSRPPSPPRGPSLGPEASRPSDLASHLLPPYWNKKLKGAESSGATTPQAAAFASLGRYRRLPDGGGTAQATVPAPPVGRGWTCTGHSSRFHRFCPDVVKGIVSLRCNACHQEPDGLGVMLLYMVIKTPELYCKTKN